MQENIENNSKKEKGWFEKLGIALAVIAFAFMCLPILLWRMGILADTADFASKMGDYEGGVGGALLSFAGLLLLLQTIKDQRRDYQAQLDELRLAKRAHEEQQFEVTFFQALNGHNELIKHFEIHTQHGTIVRGKSCLQYLYQEFSRGRPQERTVSETIADYAHFCEANRLILLQFIQSIIKLLSYTYKSRVSEDAKISLLGFVSAQLSYHEEFFLLLHLTENPEQKELAEFTYRYELFDCRADSPFEVLRQTSLFQG
ncbi:MAG: hypothetical protein SGI87_14095 [Flavobacteriales bacterium]|nr:hypothetical protein [Flavobacteriales bacterium]